jgi:hypothetical protein
MSCARRVREVTEKELGAEWSVAEERKFQVWKEQVFWEQKQAAFSHGFGGFRNEP